MQLTKYTFLAIIGLFASSAYAIDYCVSTETELRNALNDAEVDNADSVIRVRATTITLNANIAYVPEFEGLIATGELKLLGGYNAGCSERTGVTRLINDGNERRLSFYTETGSVAIRDFIIESVNVTMTDQILGDCAGGDRSFSVNRVLFLNAYGKFDSLCHSVGVRNSLFVNGRADDFYSDLSLQVYIPRQNVNATIVNNTVINGLTRLAGCCDAPSNHFVYNNIFQRNGNDVLLDQAQAVLLNNRYDGIQVAGGNILTQQNNTAAAPNLNANFVPNAGSAMIDAGTSIVPNGLSDLDVYSEERVFGAQVDIGAAEFRPVVPPNPFVVTNTNNSGSGSLVNAVSAANSDPAFNVISFNIPGPCPHRITLSSGLSIRDAVKINGYSQPGSAQNSSETAAWNGVPCIILDGVNNSFSGIDSHPSLGDEGMEVQGLAFERFQIGVSLIFGKEHRITGNQFGDRVGSAGPILRANTDAIVVAGQGNSAIGGSAAPAANFISGNTASGITVALASSTNNVIVNNRIGMSKNGGAALGNQDGIVMSSSNNRVEDNFIGGNTRDGVRLQGDGSFNNVLQDNRIGGGSGAFGANTGNGRFGVLIHDGANRNTVANNDIGRNGDSAIRVLSTAFGYNRLLLNKIGSNGAIGIDLAANGVTPNSTDGGLCNLTTGCTANGEQNYPRLTAAVFPPVAPLNRPLQITGSLTSLVRAEPYRIEFHRSSSCDASGYGQGQEPIGRIAVIVANQGLCLTGNNCTASFSAFLARGAVEVGDAITATATSPNGDTSEFSQCEIVQGANVPESIFRNGFE
jgi:hypothetical protein